MAPVKWSCPKCGGVEGWGMSDCSLVDCRERRKKRQRAGEVALDLLAALRQAEEWIRKDCAAGLYSKDVRDARLEPILYAIHRAEGM